MKRIFKILLVMVLVLSMSTFVALGCKSEEAEEAVEEAVEEAEEAVEAAEEAVEAVEEAVEAAEEKWVFGISDLTLTHPYHRTWADIQSDVAAEYGAEAIFKNAEWDIEQQILDFDALVLQNVDVIHVVPLDPAAMEDSVQRALDEGIKVLSGAVTMEVPGVVSMPLGGYGVFQRIGEAVAAYLNYEGKVFFIAEDITNDESKGRLDGFIDTMNKYPEIEVVEWQNAEGDPAKAANITEDWLTKYDDIDFIGFASNQLAVPSIEILKNHEREDIKVNGYDGEPNGLEALCNGNSIVDGMINAAAWCWNTTQMAYRLYKGYPTEDIENFDIPLVLSQEVADQIIANGLDLDSLGWITLEEAEDFGGAAPGLFGKDVTDEMYGN